MHMLYGQEDDFDDLENGHDSASARAVAEEISLPAIPVIYDLKNLAPLRLRLESSFIELWVFYQQALNC